MHMYGRARSLNDLQDTYVFTGLASIYLSCCTIVRCLVCTIIPRGLRAPRDIFLFVFPFFLVF
ncbi:hypothetical protein BDV38DRAFT_263388 [Aspergillus pseudotamarii]|uniref:Uncharacterized protein n=1 Tax=Aspergillus pseudotamarii TaxID=132259 RepID=A0A5N6SAL2_ASPPS|nr:uncharacterized protein BDV38DRAFT_263388 [Aspergillus pseudotamarii]KAE8131766.1 hypothetical protein BDV38DRAFT_263388 [Aspergillus pseudotamarii]